MLRETAILFFVIVSLSVSAIAGAMSFMPDYLAKQDRKVTKAEKQEYDRLFADRVVVKKGERKLYLMKQDKTFRAYRISLGFKPEGHKQHQGDGRTPEGSYYLDWRNAGSKFHKSLHVSYPSYQDRLHAKRRGSDPGGMIMIHGQPGGARNNALRQAMSSEDWTQGCIAVSNMAIDEIWSYTTNGTPIEILP